MAAKLFRFGNSGEKRIEVTIGAGSVPSQVVVDGGVVLQFPSKEAFKIGAEIMLSNKTMRSARLKSGQPELWVNQVRLPDTHGSGYGKLRTYGNYFVMVAFLAILAGVVLSFVVKSKTPEESSVNTIGYLLLASGALLVGAGVFANRGALLITRIMYLAMVSPYAGFIVWGLFTGNITRSVKASVILGILYAGFMALPKGQQLDAEAAIGDVVGDNLISPVGESRQMPRVKEYSELEAK